ncbi:hypothetical protein ACFP2F_21335 [Hymenobacter artigasi]|uniref:Uncharacterized protein n=1 Tax=Hymenobacter artigasi TaxID=2719616 RepID=A0ABX1HH96_9BACT|nr:hypothetical protein [Hymenobacter artigasi]NKI89628.1 hypothetical protein [Hymenobacter artigasi]
MRSSLGRFISNYQVRELSTLMLQLVLKNRCSCWLVNLRHVENINVLLLRRGLVDGFIQAGLQLASAASLRVAFVAPPIPLADWQTDWQTDWQASLPTALKWDVFEWHELPNEPAAEVWLAHSPFMRTHPAHGH